MELFDFAKLIGGFVHFNGGFNPDNTFINAYLQVGYEDVTEDGRSIFGRVESSLDLDSAFINLAEYLKGKRIQARVNDAYSYYWDVPDDLTHTVGYRGKKNKSKVKAA